jgi:hypothetical protein
MLLQGHWIPVKDNDARARALYKRHYSYRKRLYTDNTVNAQKFCGVGEHMVLLTEDCKALFVWRKEKYRRDNQTGINCSIFRNESNILSSTLIKEAVELAWQRWQGERLFTFINPTKIKSTNAGYCFLQAGWTKIPDKSSRGLVILELLPHKD